MLEVFWEPFAQFQFMQRALVGCVVLCLTAIPVGAFMVIRKMSLSGDAMSHAVMPGIAVGFMFSGFSVISMSLGGLVAGCLVTLLAGFTTRKTKTTEDSNLAAYYLISLALGVLLISLKGSPVDVFHILFGTVLALDNEALWLSAGVCAITLNALAVMYRPLVLESLDSSLLCMNSRWSLVAYQGFLGLVVLNLIAGFQALGTLMAVGLMILPPVISRFWVTRLEPMIALAVVIGLLACYVGLILSFYFGVPTSPAIILLLGSFFIFSSLFGRRKGVLLPHLNRRKQHFTH